MFLFFLMDKQKSFHVIREKPYALSKTTSRVFGVKVSDSDDIDHMESFWGDWVDQVSFVDYNPYNWGPAN